MNYRIEQTELADYLYPDGQPEPVAYVSQEQTGEWWAAVHRLYGGYHPTRSKALSALFDYLD